MPRLRKITIHGTALFVTTSLEQGLLLTANHLIETILYSCLARAQALYPVRVSHLLVEPSHVHFLLTVDDPDDVKGFMERFKTESAHALNRLLGRRKRTVWCEGYDSPILATVEDALREIAYLYSNPAKDGLEDSVDLYPGLSSWKMFIRGNFKRRCAWLRRSTIPALKTRNMPSGLAGKLIKQMNRKATVWHEWTIQPNAWMDCFGIHNPEEQKALNGELIRRIREHEEGYRTQRAEKNCSVMGKARLIRAPFDLDYMPQRSGRRTWCICWNKEIRKAVISTARALVEWAREVYCSWKAGDYSVHFPPGLYPPAMPKRAELLPSVAFGW